MHPGVRAEVGAPRLAMPSLNPSEAMLALGSADTQVQLQAVVDIKNGIIGNHRRKARLSGAVPSLVEILRKSTDNEVVVHAVAALGSFGFGPTEGNAAVVSCGAFPLLQKLLFAREDKVVASAARTIKILLEGDPQHSRHIFEPQSAPDGKLAVGHTSALGRLLELAGQAKDGVAEVAASVLARACQTGDQQHALSLARVWDIADGLLASSPKGLEAGLDLAASMVRDNAEQGVLMLRRPRTDLKALLEFARNRRPCTRLLACTCVARAVASGALPRDKSPNTMSLVLHTAIKLLTSEPHKGIKEAAPDIISLLVSHDEGLQCAALDAGLAPKLVAQCEAFGASHREKVATMDCLAAMADGTEDCRTQVCEAGSIRLVGACLRDRNFSEALLLSACSLLLVCSRSVRNLRTSIGDEPELGEGLCWLLKAPNRSIRLKEKVGATLCNLMIDFSPLRARLVKCGLLTLLVTQLDPQPTPERTLVARDVLIQDGAGRKAPGGKEKAAGGVATSGENILQVNAIWGLRNLSYNADPHLKTCILKELGGARLLDVLTVRADEPETEVLEHALAVARNLSQDAFGARALLETVRREADGMGRLIRALARCMMEGMPSDTAAQAAGALGNVALHCPEVRLAVATDMPVLSTLLTGLNKGGRYPLVSREIGWLIVNLVPQIKVRSTTGGTTAAADALTRLGDGKVPSHGAETKLCEPILNDSEHGDDGGGSLSALMRVRVSVVDGVLTLLRGTRLDSDLRRRLCEVVRALSPESLQDLDDDVSDVEEEDEEALDGEGQGGEDDSPSSPPEEDDDDWVTMTPHLQALQDQEAVQVVMQEDSDGYVGSSLPFLPLGAVSFSVRASSESGRRSWWQELPADSTEVLPNSDDRQRVTSALQPLAAPELVDPGYAGWRRRVRQRGADSLLSERPGPATGSDEQEIAVLEGNEWVQADGLVAD